LTEQSYLTPTSPLR